MSLLNIIKHFFSRKEPVAQYPETALLVYIKIPGNIQPIDRGVDFEDPLDEKLRSAGLGEVSGGGSQLGDPRADGTRPIEFCGIDVEAAALLPTLELLRRELPELGAPVGTELHYTDAADKLQDELRSTGWVLRQKRTFLHPGFGC